MSPAYDQNATAPLPAPAAPTLFNPTVPANPPIAESATAAPATPPPQPTPTSQVQSPTAQNVAMDTVTQAPYVIPGQCKNRNDRHCLLLIYVLGKTSYV